MLPRLHYVEIHELKWFPRVFRDFITDFLSIAWTINVPFLSRGSPMEVLIPCVSKILGDARASVVFSMCSGAGGPDASLAVALFRQRPCPIDSYFISDLYPNVDAFRRVAKICPRLIRPVYAPVDATSASATEAADFARTPTSTIARVIFATFHHFTPTVAVQVLSAAVERRDAILIVEPVGRDLISVVGSFLFLLPLLAYVTVLLLLYVPEGRFLRFVFTFVIPLIPLVVLHDGIVSCLRGYTSEELSALAAAADPASSYVFEEQRVYIDTLDKMAMTVFHGRPKKMRSARQVQQGGGT